MSQSRIYRSVKKRKEKSCSLMFVTLFVIQIQKNIQQWSHTNLPWYGPSCQNSIQKQIKYICSMSTILNNSNFWYHPMKHILFSFGTRVILSVKFYYYATIQKDWRLYLWCLFKNTYVLWKFFNSWILSNFHGFGKKHKFMDPWIHGFHYTHQWKFPFCFSFLLNIVTKLTHENHKIGMPQTIVLSQYKKALWLKKICENAL